MEDTRNATWTLCWVRDEKKNRGHPCITQKEAVSRNIELTDMAWEYVCLKAFEREEWKVWTAQCVSHWMD